MRRRRQLMEGKLNNTSAADKQRRTLMKRILFITLLVIALFALPGLSGALAQTRSPRANSTEDFFNRGVTRYQQEAASFRRQEENNEAQGYSGVFHHLPVNLLLAHAGDCGGATIDLPVGHGNLLRRTRRRLAR